MGVTQMAEASVKSVRVTPRKRRAFKILLSRCPLVLRVRDGPSHPSDNSNVLYKRVADATAAVRQEGPRLNLSNA